MADRTAWEHARAEPHAAEPLHRPWAALAGSAAVLGMLVFGFLALPRATAPLPAIARYAMEIALPQWKITEPVNEIVYGTRGFDTFGETFLLMAAVVSVATLARAREPRGEYVGEERAGEQEQRENDPDRGRDGDGDGGRGGRGGGHASPREVEARRAEREEAGEDTAGAGDAGGERASAREPFSADTNPLGAAAPEHSEAMTVVVRVASRSGAVILAVTAVYLCARGYSPGGGFPAGAALSGVALLLYAALGYRAVSPVVRPQVLEPVEMIGALAVIGLAITGLFLRGSVMANWLPLAPVETIASGGLLQAFSVTELVEVGTGLTIAVFTILAMKHDWTPDEPAGSREETGDGRSGRAGTAGDAPSGDFGGGT